MIAFAALAVLYGAYALLSGNRGSAAQAGGQPAEAAASGEFASWFEQIHTLLRGATITPLQQMVVTRALQPWPDDLILAAALPRELMAEEEQRLLAVRKAAEEAERARQERLGEADRKQRLFQDLRKRFVYSGYVWPAGEESGVVCAVVNGVSYRAGETLEGEGHMVKSISADEVVIVSVEQGIEVTIPITE